MMNDDQEESLRDEWLVRRSKVGLYDLEDDPPIA